MNRFAQLYQGEVIYIYETDRTINELNQIFDPNTEWFDITNQNVEVGYVQGVQNGKLLLVPKDSPYSLQKLGETNEN